MKKLAILIPLIFIAAACTQSAPATDPTVITSRSAEWDAALNAKDIDGIVALYTDDARMMAPNMEMGTGSDGVRAAFSGMIEAGLSVKLTSIDAIVAGDIGYNVGTYVLTAGDEQADVGKFVETWARGDDGVWRISNDIYNSDLAAAAAEPSMPMTHLVITHEVEDVDACTSYSGIMVRRTYTRSAILTIQIRPDLLLPLKIWTRLLQCLGPKKARQPPPKMA